MNSDEYKTVRAKVHFLLTKELKRVNLRLSDLYNGKVSDITINTQATLTKNLDFTSEEEFIAEFINPNNTIEDYVNLISHANKVGYTE
jgi:hypothetical protein